MQLTFSSSREATDSLLLEQGDFAGKRYRLEIRICQSPVCQCEHVALYCVPENREPPQPQPPVPIWLEMDLAQRAIANLEKLKADPTAFAVAKAVESEISEAEWTKLRNLYFAVKQHATEQADPDQLDAHFPPEVLAGDGSVVGYYEILPYAKSVEFTLGADTWLLDDQYCVSPDCSCRQATLSFLRLPASTDPGGSPIAPDLSLRYAYDTGRMETPPGAHTAASSGQDFLNALKGAQPDLNSLLAQRHSTLRQLYRRALSKKTLRLPTSKPGRNDPCPCGSGKKYKKCCGA